jgi:hypothetical protein
MKTSKAVQPAFDIASAILTVRGEKVLLDSDLALLYGVPTFRFNEAVKRNTNRFPDDFRFQLTKQEWETVQRLRSRSALFNSAASLKSQIAISSSGHGGRRKLPWVFTEQGAIMAANVLNSPPAVRMSVFVVRAFVKMRELLGGTKELARQLRELEAKLTARLDGHEAAIVDVLQRVMRLLDPPPAPEPPRRQIGFHVKPESGMESKAKAKKK